MIGIGLVYTGQLTLADGFPLSSSPMIIIGSILDLVARNNFKWRRYPYIIRQVKLSWSVVEKEMCAVTRAFLLYDIGSN